MHFGNKCNEIILFFFCASINVNNHIGRTIVYLQAYGNCLSQYSVQFRLSCINLQAQALKRKRLNTIHVTSVCILY